jgi:hypothetical protein
MRTHCANPLAVLLSFALFGCIAERCLAEDPAFVRQSFVGADFFIGFFPNTAAWLGLQRSVDCIIWTDVASVATTNGVTEFVDADARTSPSGFYRLCRPGFTAEDAQAKWSSRVNGEYQFQLAHVRIPDRPTVLTATVAVSGGQKAVTAAAADGQSLESSDPSDFPSVEELFTALRQAQQAGCWRIAVSYDPSKGYPVWCVIERVNGLRPKHVDVYRITRLIVTTTGRPQRG